MPGTKENLRTLFCLRRPLCAGEACSFQVDIMAHPPTPLTLASSLRVDPVGGDFIAAQKRGLRALSARQRVCVCMYERHMTMCAHAADICPYDLRDRARTHPLAERRCHARAAGIHSSMDDAIGMARSAQRRSPIARLAEGRRAVSATQAHWLLGAMRRPQLSAANAAARAVKAVAPANARPRRGDS